MCEFHTGVTAHHTKRREKNHISSLAWIQKCTSSLPQLSAQQRLPEEKATLLHSLHMCVYVTPPLTCHFLLKNNYPVPKTPLGTGPALVILDQENQISLRMRQLQACKDSATASSNITCAEFSTAAAQRL